MKKKLFFIMIAVAVIIAIASFGGLITVRFEINQQWLFACIAGSVAVLLCSTLSFFYGKGAGYDDGHNDGYGKGYYQGKKEADEEEHRNLHGRPYPGLYGGYGCADDDDIDYDAEIFGRRHYIGE